LNLKISMQAKPHKSHKQSSRGSTRKDFVDMRANFCQKATKHKHRTQLRVLYSHIVASTNLPFVVASKTPDSSWVLAVFLIRSKRWISASIHRHSSCLATLTISPSKGALSLLFITIITIITIRISMVRTNASSVCGPLSFENLP
jgi:hypothetical protein